VVIFMQITLPDFVYIVVLIILDHLEPSEITKQIHVFIGAHLIVSETGKQIIDIVWQFVLQELLLIS